MEFGSLAWRGSATPQSGALPLYALACENAYAHIPTFSVYTGYVDVEARHFFFWFFESRRNPDEDDVMLWLNGGTLASSP
jgi:carboxypeptidase C (cathepsin A)